MKGTRLFAGGTAIVAVAAASYFLLRPHDKPAEREQESGVRDQRTPTPVPPLQPTTSHQPPSLNPQPSLGTIMGAQAQLSMRQPSRIAGRVRERGTGGASGAILVQLDTSEIRAGEQSANAAIRTAQAQADKARSGRDRATGESGLRILPQRESGMTQAQAHA